MTLLLALLVLSALALVTSWALVRHDRPSSPPRSHPRDERFLPPSSLVH